MKRVHCRQSRNASAQASAGFTLMELTITVVIILMMTAMALPMLQSSMAAFRLRGTVSLVTGAIQSTRYQAIVQGIQYQIVFDSTAKTYQIQNQPVSPGGFKNVCPGAAASCPVSLATSATAVSLDADKTLTFSPGGKVTPATSMVLTYPGKPTVQIQVSSYGNINVK